MLRTIELGHTKEFRNFMLDTLGVAAPSIDKAVTALQVDLEQFFPSIIVVDFDHTGRARRAVCLQTLETKKLVNVQQVVGAAMHPEIVAKRVIIGLEKSARK